MPNYDDLFTEQPTRQEQPAFDKDAWAARKQAERENVYAMIDAYAQNMGTDGGALQAYLDVQARFGLYSVSNAILLAAQCPEATRVADYDTWKENGVYVKRGADAITILEPGKEYKKDDGTVAVSYNVKKVFDISQTRMEQRPSLNVARDERLLLKALMNNAPCRFAISDELAEGVNMAYRARDNTIYVRKGLEASVIFRGLARELAYVHMGRDGVACENPDFTAYSVSYMLCKRNGVSVEGFSFDRLPESYAMMDAKALRAEAGVMRDVAGTITADMNRLFQAQEKAQKNRDGGAR